MALITIKTETVKPKGPRGPYKTKKKQLKQAGTIKTTSVSQPKQLQLEPEVRKYEIKRQGDKEFIHTDSGIHYLMTKREIWNEKRVWLAYGKAQASTEILLKMNKKNSKLTQEQRDKIGEYLEAFKEFDYNFEGCYYYPTGPEEDYNDKLMETGRFFESCPAFVYYPTIE
jgi:hypothetical protein